MYDKRKENRLTTCCKTVLVRSEANPPALAVDQRLRAVFADARAGPGQTRRGVASELVLAPVGDGETLLLLGLSGRPRHRG